MGYLGLVCTVFVIIFGFNHDLMRDGLRGEKMKNLKGLKNWSMILGILMLCTTLTAGAGITGKVNFSGKKPKAKKIKFNADPVCKKANKGKKVRDPFKSVNANGTLPYVFVYVKEGAKGDGKTPAPKVFDQKNCMYAPPVFGVQVNQDIEILNSDPTLHNVHSMAKRNSNFNVAMAIQGQKIVKKFTKPETMVKIKCDVHGWMWAYVGVLKHPYFAVTDASGNYAIEGLAPGTYTIEAWHKHFGTKSQQVTVPASGNATADFTLKKG